MYKRISQVKNVVMFSSRKLVNSENVTKAFEKLNIPAGFKYYSLSGNLRSSPEIFNQSEVVRSTSGNIQVTPVLDFPLSSPIIEILNDSTNEWTGLLDACEKVIATMQNWKLLLPWKNKWEIQQHAVASPIWNWGMKSSGENSGDDGQRSGVDRKKANDVQSKGTVTVDM
jgi:hypothetical protein